MAASSINRYNPIARLCANCEKASVNDFDKEFKVTRGPYAFTPDGEDFPTNFFFTDSLPDLPKLLISSRQGCVFCGFLRNIILSEDTSDTLSVEYKTDIASLRLESRKIKIGVRFVRNQTYGYDTVHHYLVVRVDFGSGICFEYWNGLEAAEGHGDVANRLGLKHSSQSYSDKETVEWLKTHIASCQKHDHSVPTGDYLPDRLIDVQEETPKLILSQSLSSLGLEEHPSYAALSYCWGPPSEAKFQLKTTKSSIAQRQAGISGQELQTVQALQDAIRMTKLLSIKYLWIDSLCILQDDTSDWEQQCVNMDRIYGNARVTLIAAASRSCRQGFLHKNGQRILFPFRSRIEPTLKGLVQLQFNFIFTGKVGTPVDTYIDFKQSPLSRRGWTVQERILSTRQIVFGACNIHFKCPELCHSWGAQVNRIHYTPAISDIGKATTNQEIYDLWPEILREFKDITGESFTNPVDLLPAISGLATYFGQRLDDQFCAGHWKRDLPLDLMWRRWNSIAITKSTHLENICSPHPYLVPSWSRLCNGYTDDLRAYIGQRFFNYNSEIRHLDVEIDLLGEAKMGPISNAKLQIRTSVMNLQHTTILQFDSVRNPRSRFRVGSRSGWAPSVEQNQLWLLTFKHTLTVLGQKSGAFIGPSPSCIIHLDYNLTARDAQSDALEWEWVLLGSCEVGDVSSERSGNYDLYSNHEGDDRNGKRYPYGLLVRRLRDGREWCRVGTFVPDDWFKKICKPSMSLETFKKASEVKTLTIV